MPDLIRYLPNFKSIEDPEINSGGQVRFKFYLIQHIRNGFNLIFRAHKYRCILVIIRHNGI